ncbi:MAG: protein-disulfide reductase DsbD [Candidatus Polarisedimenticolaceae bacterium]|nr:protein-disulfide reductase DsbD [Candidatus Polarisedimenticolaceae bacterium]
MHKRILKIFTLLLLGLMLQGVQAEQNSSPSILSSFGFSFGDEDRLLSAEEAYQFTASVESATRLRLYWKIADKTFLYQQEIKFSLEDADGVTIGSYQLPEPEIKADTIRPDGTIGDMAIYHDDIEFTVELIRTNSAATDITLFARYQGCADRGVCYPPVKQRIVLSLPEMDGDSPVTPPTATPAMVVADDAPISETDQLTNTLAGGNTWLVIATFFGLGLLLALTPCVFPMIPILSGIIAGHGDKITTRKAFTLSLIYVLAMAATYTIIGILAGLFGANIQATFQDPWILSAFALLFVLLALSMFGFYELQLPSSWQSKLSSISNRQKGGSYIGVMVMGFLSALIVGPCVAPPLAGALIYIGQTGDAVLGGLALFALSMGMGTPVIIIGTSAGKLLPKAGAWMDAVKAVFGVLLLAVAIVMLERIIPASVAMVLWGILLIVSAIYMGALKQLEIEQRGWMQLWKGLGMVLLIYGGLMLVGAAAGGKDTVQPLRGIISLSGGTSGESQHLTFKPIKTVADLKREVAIASNQDRPVMLDFVADWCVTCKEMERYTFSDPKVINALSNHVLLQADVTENDAQDQALLQGHFGMPGPPAIFFYNQAGEEQRPYRVVGFMTADEFAANINKASR